MPNNLCVTVRFLQPFSHGRGDSGDPEWPPSPMRLFHALVAAAAGRWNERKILEYALPALRWLELLSRPQVIATDGIVSNIRTQFYVPDNTADLLIPQLKKGSFDATPKRTEKVVCPTHLAGDAVHYIYPLESDECPHLEVLKAAARSITHLGWGIDMVAADASIISQQAADTLTGHRWRPVPSGGVPLRVPKAGTLHNLMEKHTAFLGRLSEDGFKPVPPLSCFDVVRYHAPTVALPMPSRPLLAFELHRSIEDQEADPGRSKYRAFHHVRRVATVAGMLRNATATVAQRIGWTSDEIARRIHGHDDTKDGQATTDDRLLFLPMPSMTPVGVSGIRRVVIVGPPGFDLAPLRRHLSGQELIDQDTGRTMAMLQGLATTNRMLVNNYLGESTVWSTVTPVILPGYDDPDGLRKKLRERVQADEQKHLLERLAARTLALIWRAFHQAGWTDDALAGAEVEYRKVGWFRGLDLARQYELPPLKFPRYHLRIQFPRPVRGPLAIGAGRYRGMGVFAAHQDSQHD
jgi:CRISPR-associated protein Csb2